MKSLFFSSGKAMILFGRYLVQLEPIGCGRVSERSFSNSPTWGGRLLSAPRETCHVSWGTSASPSIGSPEPQVKGLVVGMSARAPINIPAYWDDVGTRACSFENGAVRFPQLCDPWIGTDFAPSFSRQPYCGGGHVPIHFPSLHPVEPFSGVHNLSPLIKGKLVFLISEAFVGVLP